MDIVLASKSPRRRKMFDELGIRHSLWSGEADETVDKYYKPHSLVMLLARRKAMAAYGDISSDDVMIISADTVVALNGEILGKPTDDADAMRMLRKMSGTSHAVYSGVVSTRSPPRRTVFLSSWE